MTDNQNNPESPKPKSQGDPVELSETYVTKGIPIIQGEVREVTDKEAVKRLYMSSKHIAWTPFALEQGWDPVRTRTKFPFKQWLREKKNTMQNAEAEQLADMVYDFRSSWHKDTLKTLKEYPRAVDAVFNAANFAINEMLTGIRDFNEERKTRSKPKDKDEAKKVREEDAEYIGGVTTQIERLSKIVKDLQQAKYSSLMLNNWSIELAERNANEAIPEQEEATQSSTWNIKIKGSGEWDDKQWEAFLDNHLDKKSLPPPQGDK